MAKHYCVEALMDDGRWARVTRPTPDHDKALRDMRRFMRRNPNGLARLIDPSTEGVLPAARLSTAAMIVAGLMSMAGAPSAEASVICGYDVADWYVCRDTQTQRWSTDQRFMNQDIITEHDPNTGAVETHTCVDTGFQTICN